MIDDWRLTDQMDYLYKATLMKAKFRRAGSNDHEHCEFCWEKFGEEKVCYISATVLAIDTGGYVNNATTILRAV